MSLLGGRNDILADSTGLMLAYSKVPQNPRWIGGPDRQHHRESGNL